MQVKNAAVEYSATGPELQINANHGLVRTSVEGMLYCGFWVIVRTASYTEKQDIFVGKWK
jgi:hypothetical protein